MNTVNLIGAWDYGPGYHGTCWFEVTPDGDLRVDRRIPEPLQHFLLEVAWMIYRNEQPERIGCGYMRIIDAGEPENHMVWHRDNPDGGVRYHTAITTDDAKAALAWTSVDDWEGVKVVDTEWLDPQRVQQPSNGVVERFTSELHGVLPQKPRPGERTAIFFATLYTHRNAADLYTTNCFPAGAAAPKHATLPTLESDR